MESAPLPANEQERLEALHRYHILDTFPEPDYNDFVFIAAQICETPIALISFVDEDRQWFKAKIGIEVDETPRDLAFCAHAILGENPFVVSNALEDPRFADNPLVAEEPGIRFYAGAPLRTKEGVSLGTLCVIDQKARSLTSSQEQSLSALSRLVMNELEFRLAIERLKSISEDSAAASKGIRSLLNRSFMTSLKI